MNSTENLIANQTQAIDQLAKRMSGASRSIVMALLVLAVAVLIGG
jgi:hypothetical protein